MAEQTNFLCPVLESECSQSQDLFESAIVRVIGHSDLKLGHCWPLPKCKNSINPSGKVWFNLKPEPQDACEDLRILLFYFILFLRAQSGLN